MGQIAELDQRLAEANEIAAKGGRNAMAKLESRIRELEIELGSSQSKTGDTFKGFQKAERRIKELQFQQDEDHKNQDRMSELAGKLQQKNKSFKRLRSVPNWLEMLSLLPVQPPLVSKLKEFKDFAPLSSSSKHQRPTNKFLGTTGSQDVPRATVDSVWQLKYKQEQLQGLNLQKCPIEQHVLNCPFL